MLIDHINPVTRKIYLSVDTINTAWHPAELYNEVKTLRKVDETLRGYDNFMRGDGNIDKGGGKATERYFTLLLGTRIVPWDASHIIDITGTLITDDGFEGAFCIDKSSLSAGVSVDIQYAPKQVEVINLNFDDLVYSSFQNAVWVDVNSEYDDAGIATFPNGNAERPVNNIPIAVQIAEDRGFNKLQIRSNLTLDVGDDVRDLELIGKSHVNTILTVNTGALCLRTVFREFKISGVLDGESDIFDCTVDDLEYFDGHIHDSKLNGVIKLSGSASANIDNCSALNMASPPTLDFNNASQSLSMPNWSGPLYIANYTNANTVSGIGVDAGKIITLPSCTHGTLALSGNGELVPNHAVTFNVVNSMMNGVVMNNLQRSIEYLRPHHTGSGDIYFWDPYGGYDDRDGKSVITACKTFKHIHDNLVQNAHHDIIMCVSGNPTGLTIATEEVIISKDYTFLRGPGRDFNIKAPDDATNAITITGRGAEVSGLRVTTSPTSTAHAIDIMGGANFSLIKNVYVYESANGVYMEAGEYHILDNVKMHHGTGYGARVGVDCEHIDIIECHIGSNAGSGLVIECGHEVNVMDTQIHSNGGYGIDIAVSASSIIINAGTNVFNNVTGDINDLGTGTYISQSTVGGVAQLTTEEHDAIMMTKYQNKAVYLDPEVLVSGDGSAMSPFKTVTETKDFAEANGILTVYIYSDVTIEGNVKNFTVIGIGTPVIDCAGYELKNTEFIGCKLVGTYTGNIKISKCELGVGFVVNSQSIDVQNEITQNHVNAMLDSDVGCSGYSWVNENNEDWVNENNEAWTSQ